MFRSDTCSDTDTRMGRVYVSEHTRTIYEETGSQNLRYTSTRTSGVLLPVIRKHHDLRIVKFVSVDTPTTHTFTHIQANIYAPKDDLACRTAQNAHICCSDIYARIDDSFYGRYPTIAGHGPSESTKDDHLHSLSPVWGTNPVVPSTGVSRGRQWSRGWELPGHTSLHTPHPLPKRPPTRVSSSSVSLGTLRDPERTGRHPVVPRPWVPWSVSV